MVTFLAAPPPGTTPWVELEPGNGFTVHLGEAARTGVSFTFLVVEPRSASLPVTREAGIAAALAHDLVDALTSCRADAAPGRWRLGSRRLC